MGNCGSHILLSKRNNTSDLDDMINIEYSYIKGIITENEVII